MFSGTISQTITGSLEELGGHGARPFHATSGRTGGQTLILATASALTLIPPETGAHFSLGTLWLSPRAGCYKGKG